jgi:hypothetical protein
MSDPLITAASGIIGRLTGDLVKSAWSAIATEVEVFYTPSKIRSLSRKLAALEMVKTIKNPDRPCKISSFYVAPRFSESDRSAYSVSTISDFGEAEHPLVEGIAGQGKSIFMRQLCIEEIKRGKRLPILIELRKITSQRSLRDFGIEYLNMIGFNRSDEIWNYLLDTGFGVLLLDGYDEVAEECRMQLIHEISTLAMGNDQLRIVISSRPESSIKGVSCLKTVKMCRLGHSDRNDIIAKIGTKGTAKKLIDNMKHNKNLSEIVDTPLFTTLLCIVYGAECHLPETVHEFYDLVFQTLLYRHDDQKQGYVRPRKSGLGNYQFGVVFESFCFRSALKKQLRFLQEETTEIISYSLRLEGIDAAIADKYFNDIVKITCLLVKDGSEYQFLHKSIQEYFAARFVKRLPEEKAKEFYQKVFDSPHTLSVLDETIHYLYEIDSYRAAKYFALPSLTKTLLSSKGSCGSLPDFQWTGDLVLGILSDGPIVAALRRKEKLWEVHSIHVSGGSDGFSLRRMLLEHFKLLMLISSVAADLIAESLSDDIESADIIDVDSLDFIGRDLVDTMQVTPVSCNRFVEELGLQSEIAEMVNKSTQMRSFREKMVQLMAYMKRVDESDMLEFM